MDKNNIPEYSNKYHPLLTIFQKLDIWALAVILKIHVHTILN